MAWDERQGWGGQVESACLNEDERVRADEAGESESKVVPQGRGKAGLSLYRLKLGDPRDHKTAEI